MNSPTSELFVRLLSDFTASLKHLKLVWKYDPFNTWAKEIMASFRTRYDTFILLWLLFSFFKYTQSIFPFGISLAFSLNYYYWWTLPKGNKDKVFMANTGTYTTTTITSNHKWTKQRYILEISYIVFIFITDIIPKISLTLKANRSMKA